MNSPPELREKADRYRRLTSTVTDPQALEALHELAARYEEMATKLERTDASSHFDTIYC
jgi:hypothetical protein